MKRPTNPLRLIPLGIVLWGIGCAGAAASHATDTPEAGAPEPVASAEGGSEIPAPGPASGAEPSAPLETGSAGGPPPGLDSLLKLPGDRTYTVDRRGGLTQGEWRARFQDARKAVSEEQAALAEAEARMDAAAESGQWQVAPPIPGQNTGAPAETTLDFKTRQEIRRHRDEIERLERRLREVEIEANLAAVPADWRS